ncbi:LysE family translocator [Azovibrio restrictus]|uniref:LysE family translocator n=1 Tax=Azovibrio restrictus TaxID=146938 RepID=UPI0026F08D55|nr:LysE family translocator [Azovibrio restrictus]MDD3481770.1 LysE family translocator [Azovibrio restrictus]
MPDPSNLLLFVAALTAVYLLPGPDMAQVIASASLQGVRHGLMAGLGLALSRTLHVTLSALGLAALFHAHPLLFDLVRWLGAAYLLFLAWKMCRAGAGERPAPGAGAGAGWAALKRGFLTNLLNPKALMFCALLLPQFISASQELAGQYLLLGTILVGLGLLFDGLYALAAARLARRLAAGPVPRLPRLLFSGVFGFAALRLAWGGQ